MVCFRRQKCWQAHSCHAHYSFKGVDYPFLLVEYSFKGVEYSFTENNIAFKLLKINYLLKF